MRLIASHSAALAMTLFVVLVYNLLFSFSFLPITEGWFSAYAHLILEGNTPYRDFYLYLPPLYPILLSGIVYLFGPSIFVLRVAGVVLVLLITLLLYRTLASRFSPHASICGTTVAIIYYQSGVAHITYDFTQVLTLFSIASLYMLVSAGRILLAGPLNPCSDTKLVRHLLLAGVFSSLAFLTKQSNGIFILLVTFICAGILFSRWDNTNLRGVLIVGIGATLPILVCLVWLVSEGALIDFWSQIFQGALAAKGMGRSVMFGWFDGVFTQTFAIQMITVSRVVLLLLLFSFTLRFIFIRTSLGTNKLAYEFGINVVALSVISLALGYSYSSTRDDFYNNLLYGLGLEINNYIIPLGLSLALIISLITIIGVRFTRLHDFRLKPISIAAVFSLGMIWGNGTSAGLSEIGLFVMLAFIIACAIDCRVFFPLGSIAAIVCSFILVFSFTQKKFSQPYAWWGVEETDVREATTDSPLSWIAGINLSSAQRNKYEQLSLSLSRSTASGDVLAFPSIPSIYLLGNRWPDTRALVQWFDFLPDNVAREEAKRILNSPPAIIVNLKLPELVWQQHERLFREGRRLGQREIQEAITVLTSDTRLYRLDLTIEVSSVSTLEVWHRNE